MKKDIYIIKNKINDKVYIGQADFAWKRWGSHLRDAHSKPKTVIDKAIKKYGEENFWYELLEKQIQNYDEKEIYWIKKYDSQVPNGYNVAPGGKGCGSGIEHVSASIKNQEILNLIIKDLREGELPFDKLAKKYQVSFAVIQGINSGEYYHDEKLNYPIREYFLSNEKLKRLIYSLKYELDKSIQDIANEFDLCPSTVSEINYGKEKRVDWVQYPLRVGKVTNPLYEKHEEIKKLLATTQLTFKEIAKKYNVAVGSIQAINEGTSWKDDNIDYPIRKKGNPTCKNFSQDQIKLIEDLLLHTDLSMNKIAQRFECGQATIQNINRGKIKKYWNENIHYPIRPIKTTNHK